MSDRRKNYRPWDAQHNSQQSVSPQEALPEDDLVFFLIDLIPQLDLWTFHDHYARQMRGQPPYDVTMMVILLVYAYAVGVCSSRKIATACERNLAFRAIVGEGVPDFRTISDFRLIHKAAFADLFVEVLRVAGQMGMVKLGNLSTDGTKMGANASRHKAMSHGYMDKELERLRSQINELLKQAEQIDAEQDAALGSRRGDELPDELKRRTDRLAKIQQAKARLEAEAKAKADEEQSRRDDQEAQRQAAGRKRRGRVPAPVDPTPEEKAQTNFTDPQSKIMKQSNKGFDYSYNAQAVVDAEFQIIVAAEVTQEANDKKQAVPMAKAAISNLQAAQIERPQREDGTPKPIPNTLDNGYFTEAAVAGLEELGLDPHIATGRQKHNEAPVPVLAGTPDPVGTTAPAGTSAAPTDTPSATPTSAQTPAPSGTAAETMTVKEKMQQKLRSSAGKALYAARKHIIEPVFGQIKAARGIRRFLLRGLAKVAAEWKLICLTHNLLKIWRRACKAIPS